MAAQFDPPPGPGQAPYGPRPVSPRGLYREFGMPEAPIRIHFPEDDPNQNRSTANPWYWFYPRQQPFAFSFLAGVWGPGWVRSPTFPVIKILAIDTQPIVRIPLVGATSLEHAIRTRLPNEAYGRIDPRDQRFWDLIIDNGEQNQGGPRVKPRFDVVNGQIRARDSKTNINAAIRSAVTRWAGNWNGDAATYNALASNVLPIAGFQYPGQAPRFSIPLPDGPPTTISGFQSQLNAFAGVAGPPYAPNAAYLSSLPGTAFFNINTFTTGAYAFRIAIGQLDPRKWNMSVFPPLDSTIIGNGSSSQISGNYAGYSEDPFPYAGPQI